MDRQSWPQGACARGLEALVSYVYDFRSFLIVRGPVQLDSLCVPPICSQAPSKEIYYFNFITGESIWDHPCDEHFRWAKQVLETAYMCPLDQPSTPDVVQSISLPSRITAAQSHAAALTKQQHVVANKYA